MTLFVSRLQRSCLTKVKEKYMWIITLTTQTFGDRIGDNLYRIWKRETRHRWNVRIRDSFSIGKVLMDGRRGTVGVEKEELVSFLEPQRLPGSSESTRLKLIFTFQRLTGLYRFYNQYIHFKRRQERVKKRETTFSSVYNL